MKKLLIFLMCALLAFGAFTGCNFKKTERAEVDPDADVSQKIDLKILLPYVSDSMQSNAAIPLIDEITGYKTTYDQLPTGSAAETNINNLFINKDKTYNALKLTKNQFNRYAVKAAAFADLTAVLESPKFSVMKNAISPKAWEAVTYDGKILGIPDSASNDNIDKSIIIRKDLMYKLTNERTGQPFTEVPTTLEDFKELLKAFKKSTGYSTAFTLPSNIYMVGPVAAALGIEQEWSDVNGQLTYLAEHPELQKYVDFMKELKDEGLLDMAMQSNSFQTCAQNFAQGKSIATVSNFWEMATVDAQLEVYSKVTADCVDFAYAFENEDGEMHAWQSSGVSYVTVIPNWMADTGTHVMYYIQEKLRDENFVRIVAGDLGTHYKYNSLTQEYEPLPAFSTDKTSADHFLTGTNDNIYNKYWTQIVIKGNENYYMQWKATNTDAFADGLVGVLNPVAFAPALELYSSHAAGMEDYFNAEITKLIYGSDSSVTVDSIKAGWIAAGTQEAIDEVRAWYNDSKEA